MNHHEGLRLRVETALGDGLWAAGDQVAHVVLRDLCGAQGELGHDVGVVGDPVSRGGQGGAGQRGVRCCNQTHRRDAKSQILAGKSFYELLVQKKKITRILLKRKQNL